MNDSLEDHTGNPPARESEFYQSWITILGELSHDLIGNLAIIRQKNNILNSMLPALLKGYHLAIENNLMDAVVKEKHLNVIMDLNPESHIADMIEQIQLMSSYSEQMSPDSVDMKTLSALNCLNELLDNYVFENDTQRDLVRIHSTNDFQFKCSLLFIHSLLNNFMTNALRSIEKSGKGSITMWLSQEGNYNLIHFKDTGSGMSNELLSCVFDRLLSKREDKPLPALGFCRTAIRYVGGDIICKTLEGEYTHFSVMFPAKLATCIL